MVTLESIAGRSRREKLPGGTRVATDAASVNEIPADEESVLEMDRLVLLPMVSGDALELFGVLAEPSLYAFTGGHPPSSAHDLDARIRGRESRVSPNGDELWLNWTVRLKDGGIVVGYVQASVKGPLAQLAWVVGLRFQGRGYATEASEAMTEWLRQKARG